MPKAEGKTFNFEPISKIDPSLLESFEYEGREQTIRIEYPEFSAVCPFSGLPDIGKIIIEYVPDKLCVELKSLKYYFITYRNVGIYQEKVTDLVYKHLKELLKPKKIKITIIYNTRGGMDVTTIME